MKAIKTIPFPILLAFLAGCSIASGPRSSSDADPGGGEAAQAGTDGSDAAGAAATSASLSKAGGGNAGAANANATMQNPPGRQKRNAFFLNEVEKQMWQSPEFRRRLLESYGAMAASEPAIPEEGREAFAEIVQLLEPSEGEPKLEEASRLIERYRGGSAQFDYLAANVHYQKDELELALEDFRKAIENHRGFRRALIKVAEIEYRLENYEAAAQAYSEVLATGGGDQYVYGILGFCYLRLNNNVSAETALRTAVLLDPDHDPWKKGLAGALFQQRRFGEVVSLLDTLIANNPNDAGLWLEQAKAYARLEDFEKAIGNFEMVERLGGASFDTLLSLATLYSNEGIYGPAVDTYLRAVDQRDGEELDRILYAATYLVRNGALTEAERLADGIAEALGDSMTDDEKDELDKVRARIAVATGDAEAEREILEGIVARNPRDGGALILLGQYYARNGELELAEMKFRNAADLGEEFEAEAKKRHAQALVRAGRFRDAVYLLRRVVELEPSDTIEAYLEEVERAANTRGQ